MKKQSSLIFLILQFLVIPVFAQNDITTGAFGRIVIPNQGLKYSFETHHKEWYAPGKGVVKSESYHLINLTSKVISPLFSR